MSGLTPEQEKRLREIIKAIPLPPAPPAPLARWLDENSFCLTDHGGDLYKLSCAYCGAILRDVSLDDVTEYARTHPVNPCNLRFDCGGYVLRVVPWEVTS